MGLIVGMTPLWNRCTDFRVKLRKRLVGGFEVDQII